MLRLLPLFGSRLGSCTSILPASCMCLRLLHNSGVTYSLCGKKENTGECKQKSACSNDCGSTRKAERAKSFPDDCRDDDERAKCKILLCGNPQPSGQVQRPKTIVPRKVSIFRHLLENKDCCPPPCPMYPSFDSLYYKPSDKLTRKYMKTWRECPPIRIIPRVMCCYQCAEAEPMERRTNRCRPKTACNAVSDVDAKLCKSTEQNDSKCKRVRMPCCRGARYPPTCKGVRFKADCVKIKCPSPAFSECDHLPLGRYRPIECECLKACALCEVYRYANYMRRFRLS